LYVNAINFQINLATSLAVCTTAPTYDVVLTIIYNGVAVGDLTFPTGLLAGVFTLPTAFVTAPGDLLAMVAPDTIDPTLAGLTFTVAGIVA
jgi:hypothetical protein